MSKIYEHILLATDLTDATAEAVSLASKFRELFDAKLSVVHVLEDIPPYACAYVGMSEFQTQYEDEVKVALAKQGEELNIAESDQYIVHGSAKKAIAKLAKKVNVDLIIVGSHGKHGVTAALGSTSSGVVNSVDCHVHVVRPKK